MLYNQEKNVQILIALLKKHDIHHVIVSPGMTNVTFVASIQNDPFFKLYSAVDERSAAYMACGLSFELKRPVALSCTGATSSRNYTPALTEAFYRNLPILAITSSQPSSRIGHNIPQVTDRAHPMKDIVKFSVELSPIHCEEDEWKCRVSANQALLELRRAGGGPVHINLITVYDTDFSNKELPNVEPVYRYGYHDTLPNLDENNVAVYVGSHCKWSTELVNVVDRFCELYNAVILVDSTSNYNGKYRVFGNLVANQAVVNSGLNHVDLLIHIGSVSGSYMNIVPKCVWRVSPDGKYIDTFRKLSSIFEMEEYDFFEAYVEKADHEHKDTSFYEAWRSEYQRIYESIPETPFSNLWAAYQTKKILPCGSELHLGILNSLRCWNYFESDTSVDGYSNVGGFGIDGCVSSAIGASFANPDRLYFCVVGDLAFFYDLNSIGNRHIKNNLRIMVINNGVGFEFKHRSAVPTQAGIQDEVDDFIAASGHFGRMSRKLIKNYAEDLGFDYISASSKEEFLELLPYFTQETISEKPIVFEVFTNSDDENEAQYLLTHIDMPPMNAAKNAIKKILGDRAVSRFKSMIKKK